MATRRFPQFAHMGKRMRENARVVLVLMVNFGLTGCAALDELKQASLRRVESEKLPSGRDVFADEMPDRTQARGVHSRRIRLANCNGQAAVLPAKKPAITKPTEAVTPEGTERQSASP
jgi:hypothetical protein